MSLASSVSAAGYEDEEGGSTDVLLCMDSYGFFLDFPADFALWCIRSASMSSSPLSSLSSLRLEEFAT
jgi:hypothetical protein